MNSTSRRPTSARGGRSPSRSSSLRPGASSAPASSATPAAGATAPLITKDKAASTAPYVRYEHAATQRGAAAGFERNPENDRKIFTAGVAWKPIPQTVFKIDWENVNNAAHTGNDRFNVSLGYIF